MPDHTGRFNLEGKRALVTGASRGIGAEIATLFADAGADVGIVGRDEQGLAATRQAIADRGRRCLAIRAALRTVEGPRTAGATVLNFARSSARIFLLRFRPWRSAQHAPTYGRWLMPAGSGGVGRRCGRRLRADV